MEIYHAGGQLPKVRAVMLVSLALAVAACWFGWRLAQTYGTAPGDGGELAPLPVRLAWGVTIAALGIALAAAMRLYGRIYVSAVSYDRAGERLRVRSVTFFGSKSREFPAQAVIGAGFNHGRMEGVRAPWFTLRLEGRTWPLLLDAQGVFVEPKLAERLLKLGRGAAGR